MHHTDQDPEAMTTDAEHGCLLPILSIFYMYDKAVAAQF